MDFKRIFRGPVPYIIIGIAAVSIAASLLLGEGFKEVTTQEGLDLLKGSTVTSATIIDGEQRVDLELSKANGDNGTKVQFYYVAPRGTEVVSAINGADVKEFNDQVPQENFFMSFLSIMLRSSSSASSSSSSSAGCRCAASHAVRNRSQLV